MSETARSAGELADTYIANDTGNRAQARVQPLPRERPAVADSKLRWVCEAELAKKQTGKAVKWTYEKAGPFRGESEDDVVEFRANFIQDYMVPRQRAKKATAVHQPSCADGAEGVLAEARAKRPRALLHFAEPKANTRALTVRPGPGRGHKYEPALSIRQQMLETLPSADAMNTANNWFKQLQLKAEWRSARITELESQVELLLAKTEQQDATIKSLRVKVRELEHVQQAVAEEIISYVQTTPILKEAAHAKRLEENPEWALVLGLGYNETQRRNLIYQHLQKLLSELRRITGGDVMKAKQLSDLLYLRAHAQERKEADRAAQIKEHRRDVAEGIAESLRAFVHALHDAAGHGRYPHKIRQAQQVVCTAVSNAAALSKTKTTVQEIAETLGLNRNLIAKCKQRYYALTDGDWEQLFEDRGAVRADTTPEQWREFALQFWTDQFLADSNGQAYNFVRRSERMSDEIRDPDDRKSGERFRIHWLEESINVVYSAMMEAGKEVFGDGFHYSWPAFLDLRPFYVKNSTRETCMCIYHLRWREFADGLATYRKTLKREKVANCSCEIPMNEKELRQKGVCGASFTVTLAALMARCELVTLPMAMVTPELTMQSSNLGQAIELSLSFHLSTSPLS